VRQGGNSLCVAGSGCTSGGSCCGWERGMK
jgi:hypothetical protein